MCRAAIHKKDSVTSAISRLLRLCALLTVLLGSALSAHAADWDLQLQTDRHSDFSSIKDLEDDNAAGYRARGQRNIAYLHDEARLQRREGLWTIALLARANGTLIANRDAIDALRHTRGLGRDATDRQWNPEVRLRAFAGAGVEIGRAFDIAAEWSGMLLVQTLALTRWRDRQVDGTAGFAGATQTYSFNLRSTETYDRLRLGIQQDFAAHGAGLLFGGDLAWKRADWTLRAQVRDLGWLHWKGIPQQQLFLASNTQAVDAEGFVVYRPLLTFQNSQSGSTQSAPYRVHLDAGWQATERGQLRLGVRHYQGFGELLPSIGWMQRWGVLEAGATWQVHERRLILDAGWKQWRVFAGTDRLGEGAHSRVLGLRFSTPW